jgi:HEAT repeat protein
MAPQERAALQERALNCLKRGSAYDYLPSVRAASIESMQDVAAHDCLAWIRKGLLDEHPGVRFAACMALGTLRDPVAAGTAERLLDDPNGSVRAAAVFVLHRLGNTRRTATLADYLKYETDPAVQRNAALVLGRLGEPNAVKLLASVMKTEDLGLRDQALESMALLGNQNARQELIFLASCGDGPREAFAVGALAALEDQSLADVLRFRFQDGTYDETRLAAARALGRLGLDDGLAFAQRMLSFNDPKPGLENDPPENQIMRIRQMAAMALGDIGKPAALPDLQARMEDNSDPRVQVAAARAILRILGDPDAKARAAMQSASARTTASEPKP